MNNKFKILFIKPHTYTPYEEIDIPLGLLYLSSYLKKFLSDSIEIEMLDLRFEKNVDEILESRLKKLKPDLVGITTLAHEQQFLCEYTDFIRAHAAGVKIVVGGPYATYKYERILTDYKVDSVVIGEGEQVVLNLIKSYLEGTDYKNIKGLAYHNGKSVICNDREDYISDIDLIPFPDYSLIDFRRYWGNHSQMNVLLAKKQYAPVISSRACPYKCIYCHSIFGKKTRKRSAENFFNEIKTLYYDHGVREFHIIDDIFNIDRKRMHDILRRIIESDMEIKLAFPNALRGDLLSYEDIDLLKKAGTYMITLAVETSSPRMQKIIKKNLDIEKVVKNFEYAYNSGLITKGYFMVGFPGETIKEIKATVNFALKIKLDMISFFVVTPFENTELYQLAQETYRDFNKGAYVYYHGHSFYEEVTGYKIQRMIKVAYVRFYNIKRLFILFRKVPLKRYLFFRFISQALKVLGG